MRVSASMKLACQGQRAGRCMVARLAVRVILPGIANSRRRVVAARAHGGVGEAEQQCPAREVGRRARDHCPGAVGAVMPGMEVRRGLVFEVADGCGPLPAGA
jgi:hypothetical protein